MRLPAAIGLAALAGSASCHSSANSGAPAPTSEPFPVAVAAGTRDLDFRTIAPRANGTFDNQLRAGLRSLLESRSQISSLRVYAAARADINAAPQIVREEFARRRHRLPALSLMPVIAFPEAERRVQLEASVEAKTDGTRLGLLFLAGLAARTSAQVATGLERIAHGASIDPPDVVRLSCFYDGPNDADKSPEPLRAAFPNAVFTFVQVRRAPPTPVIECEGVARLHRSTPSPVQYFNPPGSPVSPAYSRAALVGAANVVFVGMSHLGDSATLEQRFLELKRVSERDGFRLDNIAAATNFWADTMARDNLRMIRARFFEGHVPAATGITTDALEFVNATRSIEMVIAKP